MPVRLYVKVNGGADRREVSVTYSSCMCNVDKLRLANTARSDVSLSSMISCLDPG